MATAPTCMWALRSSSSRKSESRALRRSYQVSMPSPAYLLTMPVADGPNPMQVAAPHGFRTDSPADDPDAEDPRVARAQPAAALGPGGRRSPDLGGLDHRQRAGPGRHGADLLHAWPDETARQGTVLPSRSSNRQFRH